MSETTEDYLKRELNDLIDSSRKIVEQFQRGASMTSRGVSITILEKNPDGLPEFWDKTDALRRVLKHGGRIGQKCDGKAIRQCPNIEWWDGDETFSYVCTLCGVKGGGEHPQ